MADVGLSAGDSRQWDPAGKCEKETEVGAGIPSGQQALNLGIAPVPPPSGCHPGGRELRVDIWTLLEPGPRSEDQEREDVRFLPHLEKTVWPVRTVC